jgi:hypothetical protein
MDPPAQAAPFIMACLSARQSRQHLAWALGIAGAILLAGSAVTRPRRSSESSTPIAGHA